MKIKHKYNPSSVYMVTGELRTELSYKLCDVTKASSEEDEEGQARDRAGANVMSKIELNDWNFTPEEMDELVLALQDIERQADRCIQDSMDAQYHRRMRKQIRLLFISWGIYEHQTDEELRNTIVSGGDRWTKKYDFIHAGKKYVFESWDFPGRPKESEAA